MPPAAGAGRPAGRHDAPGPVNARSLGRQPKTLAAPTTAKGTSGQGAWGE